jgi:hypothetical protein
LAVDLGNFCKLVADFKRRAQILRQVGLPDTVLWESAGAGNGAFGSPQLPPNPDAGPRLPDSPGSLGVFGAATAPPVAAALAATTPPPPAAPALAVGALGHERPGGVMFQLAEVCPDWSFTEVLPRATLCTCTCCAALRHNVDATTRECFGRGLKPVVRAGR